MTSRPEALPLGTTTPITGAAACILGDPERDLGRQLDINGMCLHGPAKVDESPPPRSPSGQNWPVCHPSAACSHWQPQSQEHKSPTDKVDRVNRQVMTRPPPGGSGMPVENRSMRAGQDLKARFHASWCNDNLCGRIGSALFDDVRGANRKGAKSSRITVPGGGDYDGEDQV